MSELKEVFEVPLSESDPPVLMFTALPFGLSTAPVVFTIVVKEVKVMAQAHHIRTHNSNSNSTFIALNLRQKTDSKAHHTKTLFNIQKPETLQGSAPRRKQKGDWKFRVGMLFQRGMTSTLT